MKKSFFMRILLFSALFVILSSCGGNKKPGKEHMDRASYYNDMIKDAVTVSPQQLGIKPSEERITVYGVITEQNVADMLVVVSAAYITGESAEIIFGGNCIVLAGDGGLSSGISGIMYNTSKKYLKYYEADIAKYWKGLDDLTLAKTLLMTSFVEKNGAEMKSRIKTFMESAQKYISGLDNVDKDTSLPGAGEIKIIFLTDKGRFFVSVPVSEIGGSEFFELFKERSDISNAIFADFAPVKQ